MQPKVVIAGFPHFANLAREVLTSIVIPKWIDIEISEFPLQLIADPNSSSDYLQSLFQPATIVISGDRSSLMLKKNLKNLVIPVHVTGFDLLETIKAINAKEIVIIHFYQIIKELDNITTLLNVKIRQESFTNAQEAVELFKTLRQEQVKEVVGGSWVCEQAGKYGLSPTFYYSYRPLEEAVNQALNILTAYRNEMEKSVLFKTIVDMNKSGIIATDHQARINVINHTAEQLLGLKRNQAVGKLLDRVVPGLMDDLTMSKQEHQYNVVFENSSKKLVADFAPVILDGENFGHIIALEDVASLQETEMKIRKKISKKPLIATYRFEDIIGSSDAIKETIKTAKKFSEVHSSILIQGESGTGKELFAQSVHNASNRSQYAFVAINCAALPENLLDSELFGYEEGAFTGAKKGGKVGLFELAHQGTIFLDEISELPLHLQSRLLRVLQEKEIMRIGGSQVIPVDVRIVAASNKDLQHCVRKNTFREDLYYRIGVLQLYLPPFRERKEDIRPLLVRVIGDKSLREQVLMEEMLDLLHSHSWPGNIREFENVLERFQVLVRGEELSKPKLLAMMRQAINPSSQYRAATTKSGTQTMDVKENESGLIRRAMELTEGDKEEAAKILGISRTSLWRKLKQLDIQ
jgi:propionate catabolism operon transcriptional regulator